MMALLNKWGVVPIVAALALGPALAKGTPPEKLPVPARLDAQHDFDWEFGKWATKVRVLRNPLSGAAPAWSDYQGTSIVRPVLGGRFNLVELSVAGPAGRIEGAALRLYSAPTRSWTLNYSNVRDGLLTAPVRGGFDRHGRGIFYGDDKLEGRAIKVRFVITAFPNGRAHFEQAYSADGGSTWELNWVADDTLLRAAP